MPFCSSAPSTVDCELENRGAQLDSLEKSLKKFNGILTMTMNCFRNLMSSLDEVSQVYGNMAVSCKVPSKDTILQFRDGMREIKDNGPFPAFNSDIRQGSIDIFDPLRNNLKDLQKRFSDLKSKQKDYDTCRYKVEQTEKEYAKKDKPLNASNSYKKEVDKRDKAKVVYDTTYEKFESSMDGLQTKVDVALVNSMNSYLHCTSAFCGYLDASMSGYRTDNLPGSRQAKTIEMDRHVRQAREKCKSLRQRRSSIKEAEYPEDPQPAKPQTNDENSKNIEHPAYPADNKSEEEKIPNEQNKSEEDKKSKSQGSAEEKNSRLGGEHERGNDAGSKEERPPSANAEEGGETKGSYHDDIRKNSNADPGASRSASKNPLMPQVQ